MHTILKICELCLLNYDPMGPVRRFNYDVVRFNI